MNEQHPIFVIGSSLSGTSILRLTLTSHSEILIPPECGSTYQGRRGVEQDPQTVRDIVTLTFYVITFIETSCSKARMRTHLAFAETNSLCISF